MKKRIVTILLVIPMILLCACGNVNRKTDAGMREFIDSSGETVLIPKKVNSVISMNNYCAQIMIGLGFGDKLVGMIDEAVETSWMKIFYPEFDNIKIYGPSESAESLLKDNPDVVIVNDSELAKEYRSKGITTVMLSYYTLDEFEQYITLLCELLGDGAVEKGQYYLEYYHQKIEQVENALSGKITLWESMYYINGVSNKGLIKTTGRGSTNSELAKLSFVTYATDNLLESPANKVDEEAIIGVNPDNIIIGGLYQHVLHDELYKSDVWSDVTAVKENHVYTVPMGISPWNRYGLEVALMIPWTAATIYPEYLEIDMVAETIEFYKLFSGCELSEKMAQYILAGLTPEGTQEVPSQ